MAKRHIEIGDKFGKLTVIAPTKKGVMFSKRKDKKVDIADWCWHCRCDCGNEIDIRESTLVTEVSFIRSCGCIKKINPNNQIKTMSAQDKADWDELYNYVRYKVLGYDKNQALSRIMTLRLKGLLSNKFAENYIIEDTANYSYKTVLNTFKFCSLDIQKGLRSNAFRDENHRFNYVIKIVENNLNTVYLRMKKAEQSKSQIENMDKSIVTHTGADYQRKTKITSNKNFDELW